jgi:radical SAM/Cys-rich protein
MTQSARRGQSLPEADFGAELAARGLSLERGPVTTLQVNVGLRCDLACHHCHVEAGPKRREALERRGAERVLEVLAANPGVDLLDLTGGAPELNPEFRFLASGARRLGRRVIDRCNLTVLLQPGQEETAAFLAAEGVEVFASLPCYGPENVDRQRGRGVFARSLEALRRLNRLGYGLPGSPLSLHLVYNPVGDALPPAQAELEARYRSELRAAFGIEFHRLLTLTNMPIRRFARALAREGRLEAYLSLLVNHFNPAAVAGLMCRSLVSVDYAGRLYDCDFNQALGLPMPGAPTLFEALDLRAFAGRKVATGAHCFGCTAGHGSSCGGALV